MKPIILLCVLLLQVMANSAEGNWLQFEEGNLYFIETDAEYNWFQAVHECVRRNMSLIAVDSFNKQLEMYRLVKPLYSGSEEPHLWLGGHDNAIDKQFEWIATGQPFSFTNWATGEPNDKRNIENCVAIWSSALGWNDAPCSSKLGFICEENQLLKKTNHELIEIKEELEKLRADIDTQALIGKRLELDKLKQTYETQSLQLQEKQDQLNSWQTSYEVKTNQTLKEMNEELTVLRTIADLQSIQLQEKQEELDRLRKFNEIKVEQVTGETIGEEVDSSEAPFEMQTQQMLPVDANEIDNSQELETLRKSNELLLQQVFGGQSNILKALMKSNVIQTNRTVTNRFYNFIVNVNEN